MPTFDPDAPAATIDFVDGTTTVPANFLDALNVRFAHPVDAANFLVDAGDVATVVADDPTVAPGTILVETSAGHVPGAAFDINGQFLFNLKGGTGLVVETRDLKTLAAVAPAREFATSWGAGDVRVVLASPRYLVIAGNDSGAGATKLDIIDLNSDTLVGTYTTVGTLDAGAGGALILGRDHVFVATDTGANGTIYAVSLATATLDAGWGAGGTYTRNFGPDSGATIGGPAFAADDFYLYLMDDDDVEVINIATGAAAHNDAGLGTGTIGNGIFADGQGGFHMAQAGAASVLGRYRTENAASVLDFEVPLTGAPGVGSYGFDGRFIYTWQLAGTTVGTAFDTRTNLPRWFSLADFTKLASTRLLSDGFHLYGAVSIANGATVDGFAVIKGLKTVESMMKNGEGMFGALPHKGAVVPVQR